MNRTRHAGPPAGRACAVAALACIALVATGCSSGDSTAPAAAAATPTAGAGQQSPAPGAGDRRPPGVSGLIAAVDGSTLQVQGNGEQTAVTYTGDTTITTQKKASASALKVGDCVTARPEQTAPADATGTPSAPADGTTRPTTVDAVTVTILSSDGSGCSDVVAGGFGGFGGPPGDGAGRPGGLPSGAPSGFPSGAPSGLPSGAPSGGFGGRGGFAGFGATGEVTDLSGSSFTVTSAIPQFGGGSGAASPTTTESTVTVNFTGSTTFLTTTDATKSAIKVGSCVRASGEADDTGAVTATALALSPAVDGACTGVRGG